MCSCVAVEITILNATNFSIHFSLLFWKVIHLLGTVAKRNFKYIFHQSCGQPFAWWWHVLPNNNIVGMWLRLKSHCKTTPLLKCIPFTFVNTFICPIIQCRCPCQCQCQGVRVAGDDRSGPICRPAVSESLSVRHCVQWNAGTHPVWWCQLQQKQPRLSMCLCVWRNVCSEVNACQWNATVGHCCGGRHVRSALDATSRSAEDTHSHSQKVVNEQ